MASALEEDLVARSNSNAPLTLTNYISIFLTSKSDLLYFLVILSKSTPRIAELETVNKWQHNVALTFTT